MFSRAQKRGLPKRATLFENAYSSNIFEHADICHWTLFAPKFASFLECFAFRWPRTNIRAGMFPVKWWLLLAHSILNTLAELFDLCHKTSRRNNGKTEFRIFRSFPVRSLINQLKQDCNVGKKSIKRGLSRRVRQTKRCEVSSVQC